MKMPCQLLLTATGEHLRLAAQPQVSQRGFAGRLRNVLGLGQQSNVPNHAEASAWTELSVQVRPGSLPDALEQLWSQLQDSSKELLETGGDLSVQLGLAHSRLGLLRLAKGTAFSMKADMIEAYAKAWIGQMWGIDPDSQIIRWQRIDDASDLLISCIDRPVFECLESFANSHGLRFVSCKPAVLGALEAKPSAGDNQGDEPESVSDTVVVWTEPAPGTRRAGVVQLLHSRNFQPKALWRGWLPSPASTEEADESLESAIRRFIAANALSVDHPIQHVHWRLASPQKNARTAA